MRSRTSLHRANLHSASASLHSASAVRVPAVTEYRKAAHGGIAPRELLFCVDFCG